MKRSLSIVIILSLGALLSGCIVSKTPTTNDVNIPFGEQVTFSVVVFPPTATYAWTLDEAPLSNEESSYVYTAQGGGHTLIVRATHAFGTDTQAWYIQTPSPPVAHTGPDQTVAENEVVTLDASNSTDPDGDIVSYAWEQIGGIHQVVLSNPSAITTTFQAPDVDANGDALTFKLTVTDNGGLKSTDTCIVNVTWENEPPTAVTGPDQTVDEGVLVTLDGSASTDPDDGIASYDWQQKEGPPVTLSNAGAMQPTFTAPNVGPAGAALKFELTVTDNGGLKSTDTCIVNVTWENEPPTAVTGPDQTVDEGVLVTLDGSASTDPDDGIASYLWQQTGGPAVTMTNANAAIAQFTAAVTSGSVLTFDLTVTDAGGLQATDTCVITVIDPISFLLSTLVSIPGGTFQMGSYSNTTELPVHAVTLGGFEIGAYEVTQAQYAAIMGTNPSGFQGPGNDNNPVETVSWYEAREFCTQLSALTGRTFTLPSEAQWEYACRAGSTTRFSFGDDYGQLDNYAWYLYNSGLQTHPVGMKLPNAWGLYDMYGNVYEWVLDSWHATYTGAPTDGSAWEPETGMYRVVRGGRWNDEPWFCRSASRNTFEPDTLSFCFGFRVLAFPAGD